MVTEFKFAIKFYWIKHQFNPSFSVGCSFLSFLKGNLTLKDQENNSNGWETRRLNSVKEEGDLFTNKFSDICLSFWR